MKIRTYIIIPIVLFAVCFANTVSAQKAGVKKPVTPASSVLKSDKEEFDAAVALPPAERIAKLKAFIESFPRSNLKPRATELIVSSHAILGDEKLKADDTKGGVEQFRLAVASIPAGMSDKLFAEVVSQIPSNLFLRGQQAAALEVARSIEERVKDKPMRLLTLAAFFVGVEAADDAIRVADIVIKQLPESSAAYQARAAAHRISLRLEESATDYARALELSPKSEFARRSLAELRRATGKTEEALALYREILKDQANDEFARTGLVVSLFELDRKEEAERELESALKEMPNSLALMAGVAYWFAAHNDSKRAIEFAQKAVQIENRYTWSYIALARALLAQNRPMDAERSLIVARSFGRFPTLDYEMASVLTAAGLYSEAASALSSFVLRGSKIETWLAGRTLANADSFTELLAPERRASIFQFTAADNETNARLLKALLAFSSALNPVGGRKAINEADALAAARDFVTGNDDMRAFRRLYVASRLLENDVALPAALEMMEAVLGEVEAALNAPTAAIAVMGEELRSARAQAMAQGSTLNVPEIPRNTLSNLLRGRIEDLAGWTLFNQGKYAEAIVRLRRATSVLPDKSIWWHNSMWHLGASLDADGKGPEALEAYFASYKSGGVGPTRRAAIEGLYRRINGSLDGLEEKIGPSTIVASSSIATPETDLPAQSGGTDNTSSTSTVNSKSADDPPKSDTPSDSKVDTPEPGTADPSTKTDPTTESKPDTTQAKPSETVTTSDTITEPKPETTEAKSVDSATNSGTKSESKSDTTETKPVESVSSDNTTSQPKSETPKSSETTATPKVSEPSSQPTPEPTPVPTPTEVQPGPPQPAAGDEPHDAPPAPATTTQSKTAAREQTRKRRVSEAECTISVSDSSLTIENNGGRAIIDITLEGASSVQSVTAATSDWSALAVFPEPKNSTTSNVLSFSLTSISKKTGMFTVTFKSPCGSKEVTVAVK